MSTRLVAAAAALVILAASLPVVSTVAYAATTNQQTTETVETNKRDHRGYTHGIRQDAQGGVSVTHSCRWTKRCPKR